MVASSQVNQPLRSNTGAMSTSAAPNPSIERTLGGMNEGSAPFPRVVVIGPSCAGKSTFAQHLAEARRCARIELDGKRGLKAL